MHCTLTLFPQFTLVRSLLRYGRPRPPAVTEATALALKAELGASLRSMPFDYQLRTLAWMRDLELEARTSD